MDNLKIHRGLLYINHISYAKLRETSKAGTLHLYGTNVYV